MYLKDYEPRAGDQILAECSKRSYLFAVRAVFGDGNLSVTEGPTLLRKSEAEFKQILNRWLEKDEGTLRLRTFAGLERGIEPDPVPRTEFQIGDWVQWQGSTFRTFSAPHKNVDLVLREGDYPCPISRFPGKQAVQELIDSGAATLIPKEGE